MVAEMEVEMTSDMKKNAKMFTFSYFQRVRLNQLNAKELTLK